ncbi:MAG: radical SAM protein [Clostridia bacterium]
MERYSKILEKDKREFVLLIGSGCKWSKCKFCNYHEDREKDEAEQNRINKEVLDKITGEFGTLEANESGSIFELSAYTIDYLLNTCVKKKIKTLIMECHSIYEKRLPAFRKQCKDLGITLKVKGGVETFDVDFREEKMNKGFGRYSPEQLAGMFEQVNLLVGVEGQTLEQVKKDIEIGLEYFERICINVYKEMPELMKADKKLIEKFKEIIYPQYKDNDRVDILLQNTDFGVGD